ncbi:protein of unassigned function [Methylobacterium oryzae CBMB20]|uniref:Protein of unassigned function n=1 Tax=Methylobacterium oryzae CBMB20 TaxID=693986 RepID=A0A089NTE5_9HYPH|nr:protein of unassigned function [Methylobacterium oryzae CBMB20]
MVSDDVRRIAHPPSHRGMPARPGPEGEGLQTARRSLEGSFEASAALRHRGMGVQLGRPSSAIRPLT